MFNRIATPIILALICLTAFSHKLFAYDQALIPTQEKVKFLETEHFRILYQEKLEKAAPELAGIFEEAHFVLTRVLGYTPKEKTEVLFMDSLDTHNGWATSLPHNTIAIYAAGSEPGSFIYQPGNNLRRTVYHELMHALSMDMRSGYNRALANVFGKIVPLGDPLSYALFLFSSSPLLLAPNWLQEGQSIWAETEFAKPGRGNSALVDMVFRCAVHDNNLIEPNQWFLETPQWPQGNSAYLYGMRLVQFLAESSPLDNPVGDMDQAASKTFLFNSLRATQALTSKSWKPLAQEMLAQERLKQNEKLQALSALPFTPVPRVTPKDLAVGSAVFAGDRIVFLGAEEEARSSLFVYTPKTKTLTKIRSALATSPFGSLSATRDGSSVFYTRLEIVGQENIWYEVRRFEPATGRDTMVTNQGRYRSVDISPDGSRLTAVSQRQGLSYLIEVPLAEAGKKDKETILATMPLGADLSSPKFSPDGSRIAFVEANNASFRLKVFQRSTGTPVTIWESASQILAPTWQPDGNALVYGSDETGVYNLFRIGSQTGSSPSPVSHVWSGLFFPSLSPDGQTLAAVSYDGFGPHLTILPYAPDRLSKASLPHIWPLWKGGKLSGLKAEMAAKQTEFKASGEQAQKKAYNSFTHLRPDFWTPWLTASSNGAQGGLAASFSDPAGYQDISLLAGAESKYRSPLAGVRYSYRGLGPELTLYAGAGQEVYSDLLVEQTGHDRFDYAEETRFGGVAVSMPLWNKMEHKLLATIGFEHKRRDPIDDVEDDYEDHIIEVSPTEDNESLAWGRLTYFSGTGFNRSVSVEDGSLFSVAAEHAFKSLGGEVEATRILADANQYISMPYLHDHVLKLSGSYGQGWGDDFAQGLFGVGGFGSPVEMLSPGIPHTLTVRGYDPNFQTGQSAAKLGASYRFPIWNLFKGLEGPLPLYSRNLSCEVFYEAGRTWDDKGQGDDLGWLHAVGTEVNYGLTLLRFLNFAPGIGVVYAPQRDDHDDDQSTVVGYISIKAWYSF